MTVTNADEDIEQRGTFSAGENAKCYHVIASYKVKCTPMWRNSRDSILSLYLNELKTYVHAKTYAKMFADMLSEFKQSISIGYIVYDSNCRKFWKGYSASGKDCNPQTWFMTYTRFWLVNELSSKTQRGKTAVCKNVSLLIFRLETPAFGKGSTNSRCFLVFWKQNANWAGIY